MRKEDLQKIILGIIEKKESHGYEINEQLISKRIKTHLSYLYRFLAEMEKEGYLRSNRAKSRFGPNKKIYSLGKKGTEELDIELKKAIGIVHERYMAYLQKLPPNENVLQKLQLLLGSNVGTGEEILVIAPIKFYDWMVAGLCEKFKKGRIYLVKPKPVEVSLEYPNLMVLDTLADNLFLKEGFIDTIRMHGEPENFHNALKELHRVLKADGTLSFIVPYFELHEEKSPLTIGEFVEKIEGERSTEGMPQIDSTNIKTILLRYFENVKSYRLAHLAIFLAKNKI